MKMTKAVLHFDAGWSMRPDGEGCNCVCQVAHFEMKTSGSSAAAGC
jgi:hypothetical protein